VQSQIAKERIIIIAIYFLAVISRQNFLKSADGINKISTNRIMVAQQLGHWAQRNARHAHLRQHGGSGAPQHEQRHTCLYETIRRLPKSGYLLSTVRSFADPIATDGCRVLGHVDLGHESSDVGLPEGH
jgi:hypothetical protein